MFANTQVLTFHGLGTPVVPISDAERDYFVATDKFRHVINRLSSLEAQFGVSLEVTFDDGNLSDFTVGLPALVDIGRPGRFFVLAGRIGAEGYVSVGQMREIVSAGSLIGCHGYDHVDWRKLDAAGFRRELYDARKKIEDAIGCAVTEAAIPFGAFDQNVLQRLKAAEYSRVYTSTPGLAYGKAWFCPRWSPTSGFDPNKGFGPRFSAKQKIRSSLYAFARRLRYRI